MIIKWIRDGRPMADPRGAAILRAIWILAESKELTEEISSPEVAAFIDEDSGQTMHLNEKDIRDIARDLGLNKFPMPVKKIRAEISEAIRGA